MSVGRWPVCALLLGASVSHAAGLGGLTLRSSIGQPLDATIEVVSLQPGETLAATLASQSDYREAGVPFAGALADARFRVETTPDGKPYLRLTTSRPVTAKSVELLIAMDTSLSQARGQYSVRLPPPGQTRPQVLMPSMAFWTPKAAPAPALVARPEPAPKPKPAPEPPVATAPAPPSPPPRPADPVATTPAPAPPAPAVEVATPPVAPAPAPAPATAAAPSVAPEPPATAVEAPATPRRSPLAAFSDWVGQLRSAITPRPGASTPGEAETLPQVPPEATPAPAAAAEARPAPASEPPPPPAPPASVAQQAVEAAPRSIPAPTAVPLPEPDLAVPPPLVTPPVERRAEPAPERPPGAPVTGAKPGYYGQATPADKTPSAPGSTLTRPFSKSEPASPLPPLSIERAPLVVAFRQAKSFDPTFQGAVAERTVNETTATQARWAYAPDLTARVQQTELETGQRKTVQISQPVVAADRLFTWREATPRTLFAEATFAQREQELAVRLIRTVTELLRAREGMRANETRIGLLDEQAKRAKRMFDLGQGTITDMHDAAVKLDQARATQLGLATRVNVAQDQYASIVGKPPPAGSYEVSQAPRRTPLEPSRSYMERAQSANPSLNAARQTERIAELGASRAKWAFLPSVSAVAAQTERDGVSRSYFGTSLTFPLAAQSFTQLTSASAQADRARENTRQVTQTLQVDLERLRALVDSGQQELARRRDAIDAAELAIQANLKSQQGGIRTQFDVLNAIQTLADTRNDYANTAATLAENYLTLLLQAGTDPAESLARVQQLVF